VSPASADLSRERRIVFRRSLLAAGIFGAAAIALGAWGAHGLEAWLVARGGEPERVAARLDQFNVAARYHLVHAVVLVGLAAISDRLASAASRWIGRLMGVGIVLFSGSLYLLVITDTPWLGAITPLGGLAWIVAWSALGIAAWSG